MDHNQASLLDHEAVATVLETDLAAGLSWREARARLAKYGPNRPNQAEEASSSSFITQGGGGAAHKPPGPSDEAGATKKVPVCKQRLQWLRLWALRLCLAHLAEFLDQFRSPLVQLLVLCVLVSLLIGEYENALSVGLSILIVCLVSYVQRRRASRSLERLTRRAPQLCRVLRDGQLVELEADYLVPGDIVHLREGQRVPADIRLFELATGSLLQVNESNLTGDTQPQVKVAAPLLGATKTLGRALSGPIVGLQMSAQMPPNSLDTNSKQQQQPQQPQDVFIYQNLALMGTLIESGHSKGVVICTGARTRYGEVFGLLKAERRHPQRSPMEQNIDQLAIHLVVLACCVVAAMSVVGILQERPALEVAYYAVSLTVTAIPEGLPVVVAVIMTLGVLRLAERRVLVKSPGNVETLGCVQVLCADKTGTLTRDEMTLTDVVTSELHSLSGDDLEQFRPPATGAGGGSGMDGHSSNAGGKEQPVTFNKLGGRMYSISRLMEVATLCNNATIELVGCQPGRTTGAAKDPPEDEANRGGGGEPASAGATGGAAAGSLQYIGQATEVALLDAAIRLGFGDSRPKFRRLSELPFSSSTRRMVVQCQRHDATAQSPMYYVKGAWEDILRDCSHYYECGLIRPRQPDVWAEFGRICRQLGAQGLRVLALATGPHLEQLTFVGVVGIKNLLREGIVETVGRLRRDFQLDVKLITGDSRQTALAVGRQLGLVASASASASDEHDGHDGHNESGAEADELEATMSGHQLHQLLNTDLEQLAKARAIATKSIFYRVDPLQKASIVGKLQDAGRIVAMTGDGVNDLISLRRAHLSLVMGSGADACRELADVILLDNDLGALLPALVEARGLHHKLNCFLSYQISLSLCLILLVAVAFASHWDPPFTVVQLLYINLLADGPLAQSLAMEQLNERELRGSGPRDARAPLLGCGLLATIALMSSLLLLLNGGLYYYLLDSSGGGGGGGGGGDGAASGGAAAAASYLDLRSRSLLFSCFISCSIFAAVSLRSRVKTVFETRPHANRQLLCCGLALALVSAALVEVPRLNELFDAEWVAYTELLYAYLYGALVLVLVDVAKMVARGCAWLRRAALRAAAKSTIIEHLQLQQSRGPAASANSTNLGALDLYQQQQQLQQRSMSQLYLSTAYANANAAGQHQSINVYDTIQEDAQQQQQQQHELQAPATRAELENPN